MPVSYGAAALGKAENLKGKTQKHGKLHGHPRMVSNFARARFWRSARIQIFRIFRKKWEALRARLQCAIS